MPEIRDLYTDLQTLDVPTLQLQRQELINAVPRGPDGTQDFGALGDDALARLLAITRELRKKAAVGTRTKSAPKRERAESSLDSLV